MKQTVMIVAGEASGDLHGSEIAKRLHSKDIHCIGMGSDQMRNADVEMLYDSAKIAVVGLWEVITHWSDIQQALRLLKDQLAKNPPDLLLLIDYQEFNLKLAIYAKSLGIKVLFYVSPQVWAWRQGRIKKFVNRIDMMAVLFPFEVKYYQQANIPVRYVGHPLAKKVKPSDSKPNLLRKFKLVDTAPIVALLPGSRRSEIEKILPIILATAKQLQTKNKKNQFILPIANTSLATEIQSIIDDSALNNITVIDGQAYDAVTCSDTAIVASGTATLEVALLETPMAIVYKISPITYAIFKRLIKVPYVGLANIVAETEVAKEFIQDNAKPKLIAEEISRLLEDNNYREASINRLKTVANNLGDKDGIEEITNLALEMLQSINKK